jgi:hypothetical protein
MGVAHIERIVQPDSHALLVYDPMTGSRHLYDRGPEADHPPEVNADVNLARQAPARYEVRYEGEALPDVLVVKVPPLPGPGPGTGLCLYEYRRRPLTP